MAGKQGAPLTGGDIAKMITNPIYAGLGNFPAVIPEDQWIAAVSKMIKERGAEPVLRDILRNLRESFPPTSS